MENPFDQINQKLDTIIKRVESIEGIKKAPSKIPLRDFCQERQISRPTVYSWHQKGLIQLEKIAGRQYVKSDSIVIENKYQRKEQE